MPKHDRRVDVPRQVNRPGEGALIDIEVRNFAETGGLSGFFMRADMSHAPVPERRYSAHVHGLEGDSESVKLFFGQSKIGKSGGLRTLLIIDMTAQSVARFLQSLDNTTNPTPQEIATNLAITAQPPIEVQEEPGQTAELLANMVLCGWAGPEACLDFYQASPFAFSAAVGIRKLAVDPVVRVDMRASSFLGMLAGLRKWREEIAPNIPGV
jgi:hypothetical protein